MCIDPNKCCLFQDHIEFLGFKVSSKGIEPLESKIQKILNAKPPINVFEIRAFINMAGFYRRHVLNFSARTIKMTGLLKKIVPFYWTDEHQVEFESMDVLYYNYCKN